MYLVDCGGPDDLAGDDQEGWRPSVDLLLSGVLIVHLRDLLFPDVSEDLLLDLTCNRGTQ